MRGILAAIILWLGLASPVTAQAPKLFVAATWNAAPSDTFYQHRLAFGVRWRPCRGIVCVQAGALLAADNALLFNSGVSLLRHLAVGADAGSRVWRAGASLGQFDQTIPGQPLRYYRFVAVSVERKGALGVLVEPQLFQFDRAAVGTPIHDVRAIVRWRFAQLELNHTRGHNVPHPYAFWSGTIALERPPFQVRGGWLSLPDVTGNRNVRVRVLQLGLVWRS